MNPDPDHGLSIASYNVLADAYVRPDWFAHIAPAVLEPRARRAALARRIEALDADVVCLQEVEPEAFAALETALAGSGYRGVYARKGQGRPDGCATFLRNSRAALVRSGAFHFRDAEDDGESSGHLALICEIDCGLGRLRIAGTHLRWAPDDAAPAAHVGWRQVRDLLQRGIGSDPQRWVICGDLNGTIDSAPLRELLAQGWIDAYAAAPQPTCNPNGRAKRIDYLFHSVDLLARPEPLPRIEDGTPLPSMQEPSDHLPVLATFGV